MMARRGVLGVLAVGAVAVLGGCGLVVSENFYRFRMTVEVETPQGLKSGSSVMEVIATKGSIQIGDQNGSGIGMRGEAVVIDTADGPLFVLLKQPDAEGPLARSVTLAMVPDALQQGVIATVGKLGGIFGGGKGELSRDDWPMMVRFRDINDPKSVVKVNPEAVGVKRIVVETTSDDVTTGIEKRLVWLSDEGLTLDPAGRPTINPTFAQTIRQREFSTEIGK